MTWHIDLGEALSIAITLAVLALQFWNNYLVSELKLWVRENFIAKSDLPAYLDPLRDNVRSLQRGHK